MARLATDRLKKKYGNFRSYGELAELIMEGNRKKVATKISKLNNEVFEQERLRIRPKEKAINLPDMASILPRHMDSIKSKEQGRMIADSLKKKITTDLKDILKNPEYMRTRGKLTGTLKEQAIKDFQTSLLNTFENYTKIDPSIGVPSNIRNIAVTEVRNVVNNAKDAYMDELLKRNNDIFITKTWIHNGRLSKKPREHHRRMNGVTVPKAEAFRMFNKDKGKFVVAMYPHDPSLPPEEVIGCSCEVVYRVQRKPIEGAK